MITLTIKTQAEWDALPKSFSEYTEIRIEPGGAWINVVARENSKVEAWGNSKVVAWENSNVVARGNSKVVARENSNVVARENSNVVAWENSNVVARENSKVEAWGNSNVVARENSNVVARGNSKVVAWENSNVVARGNSKVVARGNSKVEAWENSCTYCESEYSHITLFAFAVVFLIRKCKDLTRKSKTATIVTPKYGGGNKGWMGRNGVKPKKGSVILFKRVSSEFLTQEGTQNETTWKIGSTLTHKNWNPKQQECGPGKFHGSPRPYLADQYRSTEGDRYITIQVAVKDLYAWPKDAEHPQKIAFRKGKVLYECDKWGEKITK